MMKCDISVLILTYNEEKHLKRCLDSVKDIAKDIFIVDSNSKDKTLDIAQSMGVEVYQNCWVNYAKQFQWGLDNCPIKTKWVIRLDADEYLLPELAFEISQKINNLPNDVTGIIFKRRHIFLNKWMKHGIYPVKLLRLFQFKKAIIEQRWMDEHIVLVEGKSLEFQHDFVDHNLNNLSCFIAKHNDYAIREAIDLLNIELGLFDKGNLSGTQLNEQAAAKRRKKHKYAQKPLFWRSFAYFIYRYFFKFGFREGIEGFLWHFLQGWWYRTIVDAKIYEIKKACGTNNEKIKKYIYDTYLIDL